MARKKTGRPATSKRVTKRTADMMDTLPMRSKVWVEIGPIWMERNPKDIREMVVKETHVRRVRQQ